MLSDALHVHRQAFDAVGDFARNRLAFEAADLLEVGELGDLHAVQPDFPAQAPGAQRRRFPVVLDEADIVHQRIEAERLQRPRYSSWKSSGDGLSNTWNWK